MNLVILCHPLTLESTSMPRFARMIGDGMELHGHRVKYWTSPRIFSRLRIGPAVVRKWFGYIDQFLIFPFLLRHRSSRLELDTVFVFSDQALGMWVPAIGDRPSVIHCHDFLALRSALGEFPENPTAWTGRQYQALIRRGFQKGRNFVSVSQKTREDLHRFLGRVPAISEVVYNPLNFPFAPMERREALAMLSPKVKAPLEEGYLLHVGGQQWYKNRAGVIRIYQAYCRETERPPSLLMVGRAPCENLQKLVALTPAQGQVVFVSDLSDAEVRAAYAAAMVLIFPSLEEGFGWPIVEAQACGCPVLTTDHAPMTEVGGAAAFYLPRLSCDDDGWVKKGAETLGRIMALSPEERRQLTNAGQANARRFQPGPAFDAFEKIYKRALGYEDSTSATARAKGLAYIPS